MATIGQLVIIGGAEDRRGEKTILRRVTELAGGKKAHVVVLTTASRMAGEKPKVAREFKELYEGAFKDCGASKVTALHIHDRQAANLPENSKLIDQATCVFMTGGSQARLTSILAGTEVSAAMHRGFHERAMVIAGTSAGASAISEHMLMGGSSDLLPRKGMIPVAPGLGFLYQVIIDQHFSERQRLGRLLSIIAQNPFLLGIGIDEDTALVLHPGQAMEVVGSGAVTLLDGRCMIYTNLNEVDEGDTLALSNIQLHMLPAGFRHELSRKDDRNAFDEVLETAMTTVRNERFGPITFMPESKTKHERSVQS